MKTINVGVVGATGVVGETFLNLIEQRNFPVGELRLFASENSQGQSRKCKGKDWQIQTLTKNQGNCFAGLDLVFFSSGDDISLEWAPIAMSAGAIAVDNSGAFRTNNDFALVVPEVNGDLLAKSAGGQTDRRGTIIANPNCSTIQLVVALSPLAKTFGLKSVRVASYQSVSGAGRDGIEELLTSTHRAIEGDDITTSRTFPAPIAFNCIPQIGRIEDNAASPAFGFCTEETKIMNETCKILRLPCLPVSAFTVRVPTLNSHAEAVWVTLEKNVQLKDVEACLAAAPGIHLTAKNEGPGYPTQKDVSGEDPVYIGRLHRDQHDPNTWLMWVVSDNLRKGAALNGIQIAEHIFDLK